MTDFQRVDDSYRALPIGHGGRKGRPRSALTEALLDWQTVFVPLNGRPVVKVVNRFHSTAQHFYRRARTRLTEIDGVRGVVGWFEDR